MSLGYHLERLPKQAGLPAIQSMIRELVKTLANDQREQERRKHVLIQHRQRTAQGATQQAAHASQVVPTYGQQPAYHQPYTAGILSAAHASQVVPTSGQQPVYHQPYTAGIFSAAPAMHTGNVEPASFVTEQAAAGRNLITAEQALNMLNEDFAIGAEAASLPVHDTYSDPVRDEADHDSLAGSKRAYATEGDTDGSNKWARFEGNTGPAEDPYMPAEINWEDFLVGSGNQAATISEHHVPNDDPFSLLAMPVEPNAQSSTDLPASTWPCDEDLFNDSSGFGPGFSTP